MLDEIIASGEFYDFLCDMYEQINDRMMWELYVSRVDGKSFEAWKAESKPHRIADPESSELDLDDVIADSLSISDSMLIKEVSGQ